jgi:cobalt-zinc-cadmium efflux system outer membrane protein
MDSPEGGLTLDAAVDRLVAFNYDLRTKYQDISEARADELTASLRNAPAIFFSGDHLPYGSYSPQRPGTPDYEITPALLVDYSGKRKSHMREARLETRETEARYQNAVRLEMEHLYDAYVDVLEARELVRAARADLLQIVNVAAKSGAGSGMETDRASLRQFNARSAVDEAEVELIRRKRSLAALLALPADQSDSLVVRGSLDDRSEPPPSVEKLIQLALESRPDLAAQRLGVEHDRAIVQVTQAERFDDASLFYTPYEPQNNSFQHVQSSVGWGGGVLFALPILDRNQGVIARAGMAVSQRQIETEGLECLVALQVRQAWSEYTESRQVVQQFEREGLPATRRVCEEALRQHSDRKTGIDAVAEAQADYAGMVRQYREALVRHRRSMLKLNIAVGRRILP